MDAVMMEYGLPQSGKGRNTAGHTESDWSGFGSRGMRDNVGGKWNEHMRDERGMTLTELDGILAIAFILMSFLIRMYTYTETCLKRAPPPTIWGERHRWSSTIWRTGLPVQTVW